MARTLGNFLAIVFALASAGSIAALRESTAQTVVAVGLLAAAIMSYELGQGRS